MTTELRPIPLEDQPPDERWHHGQAAGWGWALYRRSDEFGWSLPAWLEDAHRAAMQIVRAAQAWAAQLAALTTIIPGRHDVQLPKLRDTEISGCPHIGPPVLTGTGGAIA